MLTFDPAELEAVQAAAEGAKELTEKYFRSILRRNMVKPRWEYRTLEYLDSSEVIEEGFAQICRYKERTSSPNKCGNHFYRVCIQDHNIKRAIAEQGGTIFLKPLLLYVFTHEIIHMLRFANRVQDFHLPWRLREDEEVAVHTMTFDILRRVRIPGLDLVLKLYEPFRVRSSHSS